MYSHHYACTSLCICFLSVAGGQSSTQKAQRRTCIGVNGATDATCTSGSASNSTAFKSHLEMGMNVHTPYGAGRIIGNIRADNIAVVQLPW